MRTGELYEKVQKELAGGARWEELEPGVPELTHRSGERGFEITINGKILASRRDEGHVCHLEEDRIGMLTKKQLDVLDKLLDDVLSEER